MTVYVTPAGDILTMGAAAVSEPAPGAPALPDPAAYSVQDHGDGTVTVTGPAGLPSGVTFARARILGAAHRLELAEGRLTVTMPKSPGLHVYLAYVGPAGLVSISLPIELAASEQPEPEPEPEPEPAAAIVSPPAPTVRCASPP